MNLLVEADQPGNQLDDYVSRLSAILSQKAESILQLQNRLAHFKRRLREHNVLISRTWLKRIRVGCHRFILVRTSSWYAHTKFRCWELLSRSCSLELQWIGEWYWSCRACYCTMMISETKGLHIRSGDTRHWLNPHILSTMFITSLLLPSH